MTNIFNLRLGQLDGKHVIRLEMIIRSISPGEAKNNSKLLTIMEDDYWDN